MKYLILPFILLLMLKLHASGESRGSAQLTFKVQDDSGKPVEGATIAMSTFHHNVPGEGFGRDVSETFTGITNAEGVVTITGSSLSGDFSYGPREKSGYYRGGGGTIQFKKKEGEKWQPWNPTFQIVMKPVINPIPMYAIKIGQLPKALAIPALNTPIGFDLMAADWVTPYGKGSVSDFVFTATQLVPFTGVFNPFDVKLTITFSNVGDGIQSVRVPANTGSELRLPRYAPDNGYDAIVVKEAKRPALGQPIDSGARDDQNYFFRVRTIMDRNGKIKSALYGKLIGDISIDIFHSKTGLIQFSYCLNPNPNDRNMEYDPTKNLFGRLPFLDQIRTP